MAKFGQNDPIESCLVYDEANGCLVYTTNLGNDKPVKLPSDKVEFAWTGECELVVTVNGVECDRQDITPVLKKYNFNYNSDTHTITAGPDGAEVPFVLNCATLELDTSNGCELVYTNEKGGENRIAIPLVSMTRDAEACTITADDGKGGEFVFYEGANPETDIALELDANKDLCMRYKSKEFHVVLGNFVTDIALDQTNCLLKVFKWCDDVPTDIDLFAALGLTKNDDGGFDIQLKGQVCTFKPATLTQDPTDPTKYVFDNGYGGSQIIDVNEIDMDVNDITIQNSVITFSTEDGQTIPVDICAIVSANCNASLTVNADGSLTHVDNAGTTTPVDLCQLIIDNCGSTVEDNGDTFTFTQIDGTQAIVCKNPVKTVNGVGPDESGDVAFDQAIVADNNDGSGTVTDAEQNSCIFAKGTASTVVANAEDEGGGVGTATMTQNDGSVKSDVVCGAQSSVTDNEDGSATVTQNDGSTCPVSTVVPVKKDGSTYAKGDRPKLFDLSELDSPERGPIQDISCVEGAVQVTYCDGEQSCFRNKREYERIVYTASSMVVGIVESSVHAAGTVISPEDGCITVDGGKCGTEVVLEIYHSYTGRVSGGARGALSFRPEISINGGNWLGVQTGGTDEIRYNDFDPDDIDIQIGETSFWDNREVIVPAGEVYEICYRLVLLQNQVTAGDIRAIVRSAEMIGTWNQMVHC